MFTHEIRDKMKSHVRGVKGKLVTGFSFGGSGIQMSDDAIRLKVAIFADGHFLRNKSPKARISLKKPRKISRFRALLVKNSIDFKEYLESGFTRFEFHYSDKDKEFGPEWFDCSTDQLRVITEECLLWDGSVTVRDDRKPIVSFHSTSKASIDFIQFAFAALGKDTAIHIDARDGRETCYSVHVNHAEGVGISVNSRVENTTTIEEVEAGERMYCFSVPTGFFVVRQKGKIYVSGNSGKGFIQKHLIGMQGYVFDVDHMKGLVLNSKRIAERIKAEFNVSPSELKLRNPRDVMRLHEIVKGLKRERTDYTDATADMGNRHSESLEDRRLFKLYDSIYMADKTRRPNIIFDMTLKSLNSFYELIEAVQLLGYEKKNIHIVWVIQELETARKQNMSRGRVVPDGREDELGQMPDILFHTHSGATQTMGEIVKMGGRLRNYMDGDIVFAFSKANVDNQLLKSPHGGESMGNKRAAKALGIKFKKPKFVYIKRAGKPVTAMKDIAKDVLAKIRGYQPAGKIWN